MLQHFINLAICILFKKVHEMIISTKLFHRGERIAIGASGGKDSTVLAYVMKVGSSANAPRRLVFMAFFSSTDFSDS